MRKNYVTLDFQRGSCMCIVHVADHTVALTSYWWFPHATMVERSPNERIRDATVRVSSATTTRMLPHVRIGRPLQSSVVGCLSSTYQAPFAPDQSR